MNEDFILCLILKELEKDISFIETLLDEQNTKSIKFPITVFFSKKSLTKILYTLDKAGLIKKDKANKVYFINNSRKKEKM